MAGRICTLPTRVVQCEGIPRRNWMTKCVVFKNEADKDVAEGICHNVSVDLIIDSDNQPLGMIVLQFRLQSPSQSMMYPLTGCFTCGLGTFAVFSLMVLACTIMST